MYRVMTITALACFALQSCTRNERGSDQHAQSATEWEAPTAWASGPPPNPEIGNGAPLNNAAGFPEQARNTSPDQRKLQTQAGGERTARADSSSLRPAGA